LERWLDPERRRFLVSAQASGPFEKQQVVVCLEGLDRYEAFEASGRIDSAYLVRRGGWSFPSDRRSRRGSGGHQGSRPRGGRGRLARKGTASGGRGSLRRGHRRAGGQEAPGPTAPPPPRVA